MEEDRHFIKTFWGKGVSVHNTECFGAFFTKVIMGSIDLGLTLTYLFLSINQSINYLSILMVIHLLYSTLYWHAL